MLDEEKRGSSKGLRGEEDGEIFPIYQSNQRALTTVSEILHIWLPRKDESQREPVVQQTN